MAEKRMVAKKITESKQITLLKTPWAKLMFTWMIPHADDYGRLHGEPEMIKAKIFPREHKSLQKIKEWRDELEKVGLIKIYTVDNQEYIQLINFSKYQTFKTDRPKKKEYPEIPNGNQRIPNGRPKLSKDKLREVKISKDIGDTKTVAVSKKIDFSKKQEKDYNARDLVAYFGKKFEETIGWEYNANFGKDGKIMKDLVAHYKPEGVLDLIEEFFDMAKENEWVADKLEIGVFKSVVNKLLIRMKKEKK